MNEPNKNQYEEQEVDLVPVFVWISNGFKNFFNAIGKLFKGIGHVFILLLIFIKKNWIIIGVTTVLGIAYGIYNKSLNNETYEAKVLVQPNFKSAPQLISNINYYNSLIKQSEFSRLGKELGLSEDQAKLLNGLEIIPEFNTTELLQEYDALARDSDTVAIEDLTFDSFKQAKREIDYEYYYITINAEDRALLEKALDQFIKVDDNSMIVAQRKALKESARYTLQSLENQVTDIDSLLAAYKTAIKTEDYKGDSKSVFYLGNQQGSTIIQDLFTQKTEILVDIEKVRKKKYRYENTVHIISSFISKGGIEKKHHVAKGALLGLGLGLFITFIPVMIRFLNNYEKNQA